MREKLLIIVLLCVLTACSTDNTQQTLQANHAAVGTQVGELRLTGTVQAARMQTTLDFVGTRVGEALQQGREYEATLSGSGVSEQEIDALRQQSLQGQQPTPTLTPTPAQETNFFAQPPPSAQTAPPDTAQTLVPTVPGVTPLALLQTETAPPTTAPDTSMIRNPLLGEAVGDDDCVSNPTTEFSTQTVEIYISVLVIDSPPGTLFESRWLLRGEEVVRHEFRPDFAITGNCIWFFIDQTEVIFEPGEWGVVIDVNGQPVMPVLEFSISEP